MNIKNRMDHLRGNHFIHVDDCIQYLPALTYLTLGSIGINSKHGFKERIVVAATAYTTMTALTNIGKYSFKEKKTGFQCKELVSLRAHRHCVYRSRINERRIWL